MKIKGLTLYSGHVFSLLVFFILVNNAIPATVIYLYKDDMYRMVAWWVLTTIALGLVLFFTYEWKSWIVGKTKLEEDEEGSRGTTGQSRFAKADQMIMDSVDKMMNIGYNPPPEVVVVSSSNATTLPVPTPRKHRPTRTITTKYTTSKQYNDDSPEQETNTHFSKSFHYKKNVPQSIPSAPPPPPPNTPLLSDE
jgi:hypothetical protein